MEAFVDFPWAPPGSTGRLAFGEPVDVVQTSELAGVRSALDRVAAQAAAGRYAVGWVSYEAAPAFDPAMRVRTGSGVPLVWFGLHDAPLSPGRQREPGAYACSSWLPGTDESTYAASVDSVREAIAAGDTYQVNHTMRLRARFAGDPLGAWVDLRRAQRDGWFAYVDAGRHTVASVSPELFFTWDGSTLVTRPMKGTRGRSRDADVDAARAADLRTSAKDRAENLIIVDLLRNDAARVCVPGTVSVPSLFAIEAYPTVWQLTSTVTGVGRPGLSLTGIFEALFPCGSITGAPKVRTMELIADFEDRPRGVYCGAIGVVHPGGAAAFNVAIRTLVTVPEQGLARYDVGGGVVWDSEGRDEYAEALAKAAILDVTQCDVAILETARVEGGEVVLEQRHLTRMAGSAAWFGRPFDRERARSLLRGCGPGPTRARLLLLSTGELQIESDPLPTPFGIPPTPDRVPDRAGSLPHPVALARTAVWSGDPWLRHKTTRRGVYEQRLEEATARNSALLDVLLHNERGELTEFTIGNVVVRIDGALLTPPETCGLLPGTARADALRSGLVTERVLTLPDLDRVEQMWLLNAVRGWVPVALTEGSADGIAAGPPR
ncbi:MAG: aminodeoxychorismate synthase component I [Candidatus Phosphoribacter sp.]